MRKNIILPALAVAGGAAGFLLRRWQLASAYQPETGLFVPGAPATWALLGLTALLVENTFVHFLAVLALSLLLSRLLLQAPPPRPCPTGRAWVELDRAALRQNVEQLSSLLPEGCALMPAMKANAYGHGAVLAARELNRLGVRAFCVAAASEGAELRRHGVRGEILVLGYTHPEEVPLLRRYRLTQTAVGADHARQLNACGKKLRVHLKIDTGMHRLGIPAEQKADI